LRLPVLASFSVRPQFIIPSAVLGVARYGYLRGAFPMASRLKAIIEGGFPPASRRIAADKASKLSYGSQNPGVGGQARP